MFCEKYEKMVGQLKELNKQRLRGMDVSIVMPSFLKLAEEVDTEWNKLTLEEKRGYESTGSN